MDDTMADIFGSEQNQQQVTIPTNTTTSYVVPTQNISTPTQVNQTVPDQANVISMQDLIMEEEQQSSQKTVVKKKDKILMIQLALIIGWVVTTVLVYYFGYGLFEPFIEV
ncbi:MAG: hypothetical protein IKF36_03860 [Bacilli bacterium]|nr:hypothetical protein [Bacilli bacterium]